MNLDRNKLILLFFSNCGNVVLSAQEKVYFADEVVKPYSEGASSTRRDYGCD